MPRRRRAASLLLCCLLLAGLLPSCVAPTNPAPEPSGRREPALAHLTISVNMTDAEKQKNDALYDYFSKKFNVDLQPVPFAFNDWQERIRVWIVSGSLPDLIWLDVDENTFSEYASWARSGIFRALPDDIKTAYPNIGAMLDRADVDADEKLTIGGKLYAYPMLYNTESRDYLSSMGFYYRRDWADALGMAKPGDIYTWEEFVALGRAFVEQDPGNNGPGKTVGAGAPYGCFPQAFGIWQLASENGLGPFQQVGDHYEWTAARPETLEGLLTAKQLYDDGVIWRDTALGSNYLDKYKAGLMGIVFDSFSFSRVTDIRKALKQSFLDVNPDNALRPMYVRGPDGTFWAQKTECFAGAVALRSGIEQEKVDRALTMFDWLLGAEGTAFRLYGFEGKDYARQEDGITCLWRENTVTGGLSDPYPAGCRQFYFLAAPAPLYSPIYAHSVIAEGNTVANFAQRNAKIREADPFASFYDSATRDSLSQLSEQTQRQMIKLITTAGQGALPTLWTQWVQQMLPQVQPLLDELTGASGGDR